MDYSEKKTKIKMIIGDIIFWILSIFVLIFSFGGFATKGGTSSGIVLLVTAILINPLLYKVVCKKIHNTKRWICAVICLVGFVVGILSLPTPQKIANDKITDKSVITEKNITNDVKNTSADTKVSTDDNKTKNDEDKSEKEDNKKSDEFFTDDVVKGSLPEIDNGIVDKLTEAGYTI